MKKFEMRRFSLSGKSVGIANRPKQTRNLLIARWVMWQKQSENYAKT